MKKLFSQLLILLLLVQFIGCSDDDESPKASITLSVNGASESVKFSNAILGFEQHGDREGRTLNFNALSGNNFLTVAVSNWSFQNPPENGVIVKKYENLFTDADIDAGKGDCEYEGIEGFCDGGTVTYTSDDFYATAFYEGSYEGFVQITKCDTKSKRISGSFDVIVSDGFDVEFALKGEFKDLPYIVH